MGRGSDAARVMFSADSSLLKSKGLKEGLL